MHITSFMDIEKFVVINSPLTVARAKEINRWCAENCEGYWILTRRGFDIGCGVSLPSPVEGESFTPPNIEIDGYLLGFTNGGDCTKFTLIHTEGKPKRRRKAA